MDMIHTRTCTPTFTFSQNLLDTVGLTLGSAEVREPGILHVLLHDPSDGEGHMHPGVSTVTYSVHSRLA